jgi:hypothetical protein
MFRNKSRKTSKSSSPIQVKDEELVTNQKVSSPKHVSSQEPIENLAKEKEKERTDPIWIYNLDVNCTCHVIVQMTCGTFLLVHMDPQKFHFQVTRGSLSCFHITILTGRLASYGLATWHPFDF